VNNADRGLPALDTTIYDFRDMIDADLTSVFELPSSWVDR
jgi:hypothetical protein